MTNTKMLVQYQTWLEYITILYHMPLVWEISGSCSVYQTWHQAAITQLKHFIFHDNFISLPDFKTFSILLKNFGLLVGRSNAVLKCTYFKINCLFTSVNKPGWKAFYPNTNSFNSSSILMNQEKNLILRTCLSTYGAQDVCTTAFRSNNFVSCC